jgi:ribosomal protein S12 methylthiotransferase accessory factor YcaO
MSEEDHYDPATALLTTLAELRGVNPNDWTDGPVFDLALRLDRVVALHRALAEVQSWLELALAERMETDDMPVEGVGVLHRTEAHRSSWKHAHSSQQMREDLATAVATHVAVDVGTGDIDPVKCNIARHAVELAYEAIPSFTTLKVVGRDRLGLKMGDYRSYDHYYKVNLEVTDGQ